MNTTVKKILDPQVQAKIQHYLNLGIPKDDVISVVEGWRLEGDQQFAAHSFVAAFSRGSYEYNDKRKPKSNWRDKVQTYDSLMSQEFEPIAFTIENFLPRPGLAILGAVKKAKKSWLVLDLAIQVASGKPILGLSTKKASVLYFALEDGQRRISQRLKLMQAPSMLPITFIYDFPQKINTPAGKRLLNDMVGELKPGLAIIDTLAASKNSAIDENDNGQMADLINFFHDVCNANDLSLLLVAHHGKKSSGDVGFDIRGASSTPGATDVNAGLYRQMDGTTNLKVEGRDIPDLDLTIRWNQDRWRWELQGQTKDVRKQELIARYQRAIEELGDEASIEKIANQVSVHRTTAQRELERLYNESGGIFLRKLEKSNGNNKTDKFLYYLRSDVLDVHDISENKALSPDVNETCVVSVSNDDEEF